MTDWYYADAANTRHGPITTPALLQLRQQGSLGEHTLLWREGLDGWLPLRDLAHEFAPSGAAAPLDDLPAPPAAAEIQTIAPAATPAAATPVVHEAHDARSDAGHVPAAFDAPPATSPYAPPTSPVAQVAAAVHGGEVVDAGFLKRMAALFIDSLVVGAAYYAILIAVMVVFGLGGALSGLTDGSAPFGGGTAAIGLMAVIYLAYPVISGVYYVLMESSSRQATLGKMAVGIKVAGLDGNRIGRGRALGRWASHLISYLTLYIGYLVALFTQRKQGLHDMVASTYVVDQWAYTAWPERQQPRLGTVATVILVIWGVLILLGIGFVILAGILSAL